MSSGASRLAAFFLPWAARCMTALQPVPGLQNKSPLPRRPASVATAAHASHLATATLGVSSAKRNFFLFQLQCGLLPAVITCWSSVKKASAGTHGDGQEKADRRGEGRAGKLEKPDVPNSDSAMGGVEVKIEEFDGTYACVICSDSVRGGDALRCAQCSSNPVHVSCVRGSHFAETCPQCSGKTMQPWTGRVGALTTATIDLVAAEAEPAASVQGGEIDDADEDSDDGGGEGSDEQSDSSSGRGGEDDARDGANDDSGLDESGGEDEYDDESGDDDDDEKGGKSSAEHTGTSPCISYRPGRTHTRVWMPAKRAKVDKTAGPTDGVVCRAPLERREGGRRKGREGEGGGEGPLPSGAGPLRACFAQDDDGKLVFRCPRHHEFVFTEKNHLLAYKDSDMWNEKENPRLFALTLRKLREDLLLSQEHREDDCRCIVCVCVCVCARARAGGERVPVLPMALSERKCVCVCVGSCGFSDDIHVF